MKLLKRKYAIVAVIVFVLFSSKKSGGTSSLWVEVGGKNTSDFNNSIHSISIDSKYHVYAAGDFTNSKGKYYVAEINQYN